MSLGRHGEIIAEMEEAWEEEKLAVLNQVGAAAGATADTVSGAR